MIIDPKIYRLWDAGQGPRSGRGKWLDYCGHEKRLEHCICRKKPNFGGKLNMSAVHNFGIRGIFVLLLLALCIGEVQAQTSGESVLDIDERRFQRRAVEVAFIHFNVCL